MTHIDPDTADDSGAGPVLSPVFSTRGRSMVRYVFQEAASEYSEEQWAASWMQGLTDALRTVPRFLVMALLADGWPDLDEGGDMVWVPLTDDERRRAHLMAFTEDQAF